MSKNLKTQNKSKTLTLTMWGPVLDSAGWFMDEDQCVTPRSVANAIKEAGDVEQIDVHINSPGGSVFAGQAIYNMLRQHTANVTVYVDGLAASIASVIAMAGNKVVMPPGAMMMVHDPLLTLWGSYQAKEMRELAGFLDKVKESIVATYTTKCTKKTKDEIMAIMDATTWMTAEDAVEMGFADEVEQVAPVTASLNNTVLNIAGMNFDLAAYGTLPPVNCADSAQKPDNTQQEVKIVDLNQFKNEYPDIYTQAVKAGVDQERNRIKAIEDLGLPGHDTLIAKAKFETGDTAEAVAVQIVKAENALRQSALANMTEDAAPVATVPQDAPPQDVSDEEEIRTAEAAWAKAIADAANVGRV